MKNLIVLISLFSTCCFAQEPYTKNQTYTYDQVHDVYSKLVEQHPKRCKLIQFGTSDYGKNIELFVMNNDGQFQPEFFKKKSVLLINNAIHPGEPCGVDACVLLAKKMLASESGIPHNMVIAIIPMYNIGGAHNRNCCSRANQNGPEEYGFRGNAKNLDLNRDFIKADSRNTRTFYKIFHYLNPTIFVDTHTSNGADYKHIMTLITSQTDKMHPYLRNYTVSKLNPALYDGMKSSGHDMIPYVHSLKQIPDDGIIDYLETPRYSTGYTNLFNTIGFVTEAHMLKTFEERVTLTYEFLWVLIQYMQQHSDELLKLKQQADYNTGFMEYIPINWELDTNSFEPLSFQGYTASYRKSEVTGLDRLYYDHEQPWTKEIPYYNHYLVTDSVKRPNYYIIPQSWQDVIIRLQMNNIKIFRLNEDRVLETEVYYIDDMNTLDHPYEGHYLHRKVQVSKEQKQMTFHKGDYVVPTSNAYAQFIVQTLEPHAVDSYFAWNYFDGILQQKEWFSAYVFEETAKQLLEEDHELKAEFEKKKKEDVHFAKSAFDQLYFIYKRSPNYERTYNQYPVCRYNNILMSDEIEEAPRLIGG